MISEVVNRVKKLKEMISCFFQGVPYFSIVFVILGSLQVVVSFGLEGILLSRLMILMGNLFFLLMMKQQLNPREKKIRQEIVQIWSLGMIFLQVRLFQTGL